MAATDSPSQVEWLLRWLVDVVRSVVCRERGLCAGIRFFKFISLWYFSKSYKPDRKIISTSYAQKWMKFSSFVCQAFLAVVGQILDVFSKRIFWNLKTIKPHIFNLIWFSCTLFNNKSRGLYKHGRRQDYFLLPLLELVCKDSASHTRFPAFPAALIRSQSHTAIIFHFWVSVPM